MTPAPDTISPEARAEFAERIARAADFRSTGARAARPTTKPGTDTAKSGRVG